ncbi:MAG: ATP-binding protein [Mobilitalea sp.]
MKRSLRVKLTLLLTAMVVATILFTWLMNNTFLNEYYVHTKMKALNQAYQETKIIYDEYLDSDTDTETDSEVTTLSEEDTIKMERLASKYDVDIYVYKDLAISYPAQEDLGNGNMFWDFLFQGVNDNINDKVILEENNRFYIMRLHDIRKDTNYLYLMGLFENDIADYQDNDTVIMIRSNMESIEESAKIANNFLAYIGTFAALIGAIAMFFISKSFTKPILAMAGIAKKMSDLDFDAKYNVTADDEIGELGNSINSLSDKLETTISELKMANNELTTDIQHKIEIDEMRKEFLSNVSHELKTPIALIQGYAEGLKENINEDAESRDFYCEVIMDEADKMNKMVKKLLSLNELEFGNNQISFERFDIIALIRSIIGATDILFKQKEVTLYFEDTEPVYVWADVYMVEQVVTNYISNALNHVEGAKIIEIKIIHLEDKVRIAVFNTGENIPEEDIDKIWIKFYKVDKARTREYGGSGIGLSIVKAIMNSMNQECGVFNRSVGVEFWFELDTKA